MKYSEKLKDPRWQKKRLEIFQRDHFACTSCGNNEEMLCVHHLCYENGKEPWDYANEFLLTLCASCHEYESNNRRRCEQYLLYVLSKRGFLSGDIKGFAKGFQSLKIFPAPEVSASIIEFALSSEKIMGKISDMYFKHLYRLHKIKQTKQNKVLNG